MARRATTDQSGEHADAPTASDRSTVGRPPTISLDDILVTATRLAEEVGVGSLTMGLVADELGVTSAALYHYVENKQALVNKVFDRALEKVEVPPAEAGTWDQRLKLLQGAIRIELRRLKWESPQPITSDDDQAPGAVSRLGKMVMQILGETGAEEHDLTMAFTLIYVYFTGQLWYDNSSGLLVLERNRRLMPSGVAITHADPDELFDFSFDIILAGLRERLEPSGSRTRPRK